MSEYKPERRCAAGIEYTLNRVGSNWQKNIYLRVRRDGGVYVDAPAWTDAAEIDAYVGKRADKIKENPYWWRAHDTGSMPGCEDALALFTRVSEQYFPLFRDVLGGRPPELWVNYMPGYLGKCYPSKRRIALDVGLAKMPLRLVEDVVLHEYCHFVHLGHGPKFWALLESYMPDARARQTELTGETAAWW